MDMISTTLQNMLVDFLGFLPNLIVAILIFLTGLYFAGLLAKIIRTALVRRNTDKEITILIGQISRWMVIILGTVLALQQVGFNVTAFLTGLGILGFTVGFALQDISKNFVAGILLLLEQPFQIGDVIEVGDFSGTVGKVKIRATEIYTFDGQNVLIPNAEVFTSPIKNFNRYSKRRIDIKIGVAYDSNLDLVRETVLNVIQSIPGNLVEPAPRLIFDNFGESTLDFTVYFWVDLKIGDYMGSIDKAITGINKAFGQAGIEMPYPTCTVLVGNNPSA
jgi:small conductance mechanosensitive channel